MQTYDLPAFGCRPCLRPLKMMARLVLAALAVSMFASVVSAQVRAAWGLALNQGAEAAARHPRRALLISAGRL